MKTKGTVLIFAYECYPCNRIGSSIGAQRPYQFAKNLSAFGWKVIVLCSDHGERNTLHSKDLKAVVSDLYQTHRLHLAEQDYTIVPLPSLTHYGLSDYLWQKTIVKGSGGTYIGKGFPYAILRKVTTFYNQLFYGDYSWSWVPVAETFFEALTKDHKIDIIIGEHSPDAGIILADKCSRKYNIPWVADFRDPVLWPFKGLLKYLYKPVVQRIVSSASTVISVNPYWSSLDAILFQKKTYVLLNGYDKTLFESIKAYQFKKFTVSYFGSFDDHFQDIIPSLKACFELLKGQNFPADITLFYRGLKHAEFLKHALFCGIPLDNLDVQEFCERETTVAFMKGSHVLLIYSIPSYRKSNVYEQQGFYPGKVFEYIGTGNPILLVPSDDGLLDALIRTENIGTSAATVEGATSFLEEQYRVWSLGKGINEKPSLNIFKYSREGQAMELDKILTTVLQSKR